MIQEEFGWSFHGLGVLRAENCIFDGLFDHGMLNGPVQCQYAGGSTYVGQYVQNMREGQGTYTFRDGRVLQGAFKDHSIVQGKCTSENGDVYEGAFMSYGEGTTCMFGRHGQGTFIEKATGTRYEGMDIVLVGKSEYTPRTTSRQRLSGGAWRGRGGRARKGTMGGGSPCHLADSFCFAVFFYYAQGRGRMARRMDLAKAWSAPMSITRASTRTASDMVRACSLCPAVNVSRCATRRANV
jgi:hypothetical protein